jgi:DNA polymerase III sliding clamp (beta) subunit (PCNA family)
MLIKEAIALAAKYVSKRPSHPVLACIRSTATHLEAFDLETAISVKLSTPTPEFCVHGESLKKTTAKLDKFSLTTSEGAVQIHSTGTNAIATITPDQFPELPEVTGESFTIWESKLFKAWSTVKGAVNPKHHSRMLHGVSIKIRDNIALVMATDGHKAATAEFRSAAPDCSLIIPVKFFEILKAKSDRELMITHDQFNVQMAIGDIVITSRLLEGSYPDPIKSVEDFAVLDQEYRGALLDNLAIAKAMGSKTIDLYIRGQELILKCFTTDKLEFSGRIETPAPTHLFYFATAIANPCLNYWSYSGGWTNPQTKERSKAHLYFSLKYEYIANTMCFTLPMVMVQGDRQARIDINNLVKILKGTDKDRDLTIALDTVQDVPLMAIGSLGKSNASILACSKEPPAPYGEVLEFKSRDLMAA